MVSNLSSCLNNVNLSQSKTEKELELKLRELDLLKQEKSIQHNKEDLADKVNEINMLLKTAMPHINK